MRRPQLTLSDHLKKNLLSNSLAGIDFQQFLKNKMVATANSPQIFTLSSLIHQHLVLFPCQGTALRLLATDPFHFPIVFGNNFTILLQIKPLRHSNINTSNAYFTFFRMMLHILVSRSHLNYSTKMILQRKMVKYGLFLLVD